MKSRTPEPFEKLPPPSFNTANHLTSPPVLGEHEARLLKDPRVVRAHGRNNPDRRSKLPDGNSAVLKREQHPHAGEVGQGGSNGDDNGEVHDSTIPIE